MISEKITPIYNVFIVLFAAIFGYFTLLEENECFARDQSAWGVEYSNTVFVTHQFYLLSVTGMILLLLSALMYFLQSKESMFDMMRPYVICINLCTFVWFMLLQLYRFKETGRACSGDFLTKVPANYGTIYLGDQGQWFAVFIVAQYVLYILSKVISICITNRLEADFDE